MKNNWQTKKLGEICDVIGGGTPSTVIPSLWYGDIVWITPKDLGGLTDSEIISSAKTISEKGLKQSSAKLLPVGAVVLSSRAPIGYVAIAGVPLATNQGCRSFVCDETKIHNKYLYHYLLMNTDLLNSLGEGSTFKEISGSKLKEIPIPLPPLPTQLRIVSILDSVFSSIAIAKENTEKNLKNSRELFESYLQNTFSNTDGKFESKQIKDIAEIKGGKRAPKGYKLKNEKTRHPYIRVADFNDYGGVDLDDIKYINNEVYEEIKRYTISTKDLYISIAGTIGKTGIIPQELEGANLTENACKLVFKDDIYNKYIYYFTKSAEFISQAGLNTRKVAMPKLALTRLGSILIPVPKSISEQKSIVSALDSLSAQTKKLESLYKQKLANLEELKKSVLKKAFSGEL